MTARIESPDWRPLVLRDDWGYRSVHIGHTESPAVTAGPLRVRWPDGTEETVLVTMQPYATQVREMGRESKVEGVLPVIAIPHHDASITVPLHEIGGLLATHD